ncbi:MAG: FHA domain-containing protein [Anaerolineaceae bacterium]|nr:FHA domain-containing protein [Anaerolineaceae bacterium]
MDRPTRRMPDLEGSEHIIKWGTATLAGDAQIKLQVLGMPKPILVQLGRTVIMGREDQVTDSELNIDLSPYQATEYGVSRQHASLELVRKTVMLTDLGSTNGTFLNEQRVMPRQRRVVRHNDEIRLGKLIIYIYF